MAAANWEFWIDVGGTFTDCLAKAPDGSIRRHKLLSSGVTKGRVGSGSSQQAILDPRAATIRPTSGRAGGSLLLMPMGAKLVEPM